MGIALRSGLAGAALCVLAACGGGGSDSDSSGRLGFPPPGTGGTYTHGVFAPRADFAAQCASPRPGTSDRPGSPLSPN